ncbi:hypothetical protein J2S16_000549 [Cytobacillus kochii]|nr:hypothetical protein [Cytobacillus kochii]
MSRVKSKCATKKRRTNKISRATQFPL